MCIRDRFQSQKIIPFACMETSLRSLSCKNFAQGLAALDDLHQQPTQNGARVPTGVLNEMLARATARMLSLIHI